MKKLYIILAVAIAALFAACTDKMTQIHNPADPGYIEESDKSFETEFLAIWEGVNQSYTYWNITDIDWDARRGDFTNLGIDLDTKAKAGNLNLNTEKPRIEALFAGLKDNHMSVTIVNPYIADKTQRQKDALYISIGDINLNARPVHRQSIKVNEDYWNVHDAMIKNGAIQATDGMTSGTYDLGGNSTILVYTININDNIPYLHMSGYSIGNILKNSDKDSWPYKVLDTFFSSVKKLKAEGKLKGVILDNRSNNGGSMDDLYYVVGLYINENLTVQKTRTKNGIGKYDFSVWTDNVIEPETNSPYYVGALGSIPYVVLLDQNSVSMAEFSTNAISQLNGSVVIGEQSYGGVGQLTTNASYKDKGYCGSYNIGNEDYGHSIYCVNWQCKLYNKKSQDWEFLEDKGLEPDIVVPLNVQNVLNKSGDNQLQTALEYIKSHQQ